MVVKEELSLEEIIRAEEELRFLEFSNEEAIRLFESIIEVAVEKGGGICCQIVLGDFTVVKGFMSGTDENNSVWLERKKNTVLKSHKSSLRCGLEAKLGVSAESWYGDTENYVIRGGGFPIWETDGTFRGAVCVSGRYHLDDQKIILEAMRHMIKGRKEG